METENAEQLAINKNELIASLNDENETEVVVSDKTPSRRQLFGKRRKFTEDNDMEEIIQKEPGVDKFPKVKVRTSSQKIDEKIMRCAVQCLLETTVSTRDVCKMIKNVANIIFEQDWVLLKNKKDSCENDVGG